MACGVPVLSGNADGSADPLQDGRLGWRVPHRDPEAVATACITILQEIAKREQGQPYDRRCDSNWLREQAIALFDKAAFAQQFQALLRASQ
ncbi:glycosyltransferase [Leptolyngbya sp. 7M]|nr:glycosyltransferase [Leptolyngbya sp. 7M]